MLENQTRDGEGTFFDTFHFRGSSEGNPVQGHAYRLQNLEIGARAAAAAVAGFEEQQGGHKGKSKQFLPVFHQRVI